MVGFKAIIIALYYIALKHKVCVICLSHLNDDLFNRQHTWSLEHSCDLSCLCYRGSCRNLADIWRSRCLWPWHWSDLASVTMATGGGYTRRCKNEAGNDQPSIYTGAFTSKWIFQGMLIGCDKFRCFQLLEVIQACTVCLFCPCTPGCYTFWLWYPSKKVVDYSNIKDGQIHFTRLVG